MKNLVVAACLAICGLSVFATDYTWTGATGNGKWRDAGNWSGGDGTAYPSVRPSAEVSGDTATFPSGEVTLTDTPADCGRVTVSAGAVVTVSVGSDIRWDGIRGPGKLIKQGSRVVYLGNDSVDGLCLYDDAVLQVEAGGFGLDGKGAPSVLTNEFKTANAASTIGNATVILKGEGDLGRGGGSWPGLAGTMTVEVEEGLVSGKFLNAFLYASVNSKIIKTGGGTLNFNASLSSSYAKGDFEIREGEVTSSASSFEVTKISGSGVLSATNLVVRGSNDLFTGTIAFRENGSSALVYDPFGMANASVEVAAASCNLSFNAPNGRVFKPIAIPEGKTLTISSLGGGTTHFCGLCGPGKVVLRTPNGSGWLYIYNRLEDQTGALSGGLQVELSEKCMFALRNSGFGISFGTAEIGNVDITYATGAKIANEGNIQLNGPIVIRSDSDVSFGNSYVYGSGNIVKEGSGLLTWTGCFGWGSGTPFRGDISVKEGGLKIRRNKTGQGYIIGKIEGPGTIEYVSDEDGLGARDDYFLGPVTAPFTCTFGKLYIKSGAEFADMALGDRATVIIDSPLNPLRVHGTLTAVEGAANPVIRAAAGAFNNASGSVALILSDTAFDTTAFTYDLSAGSGWTAYAYGDKRVYARTASAANVWTGLAGTVSWGDAANWADGVPTDGDVALYGGDFERINVSADPGFSGTLLLRGAGDAAFSGAGLSDVAVDVSKFTGRFVKRGADTYLVPASCNPPTFVVAEGVAVKAGGTSGGKTIIVEDGGQFDFNGKTDSYPYPVCTIAGSGPDGSGALVNTGDDIDNSKAQIGGLVLADDAAIGGTVRWCLINRWYEELPIDLGGHTLTKVGNNAILFANLKVTEGTIAIAAGTFQTTNAQSDFSKVSLALMSGGTLGVYQELTVGTLACGVNSRVDQSATIVVLDEISTSGAITFKKLRLADGATFTPNGTLTISQTATFGENLTLDLSNWTPASGRTLLKAPGVTTGTFSTVTDLAEGYAVAAKDDRLYLHQGGILLIFR